jgi:hypothetical protein
VPDRLLVVVRAAQLRRASGEPPEQLLVGRLEAQNRMQRGRLRDQVEIQRLGLGNRPRKAVEQKSPGAIGRTEAIHHHRDHDLVWNQVAFVEVFLRGLAELGPLRDV